MGVWNHQAIVRDIDARKSFSYLDGAAIPNGGKDLDASTEMLDVCNSSSPLYLGNATGNNPSAAFPGQIDELRISNVARSADWLGDRSTSYYDPFRGEWVFSLRSASTPRTRHRFASRRFGGDGCRWTWPGDQTEPESLRGAPEPEAWLALNDGSGRELYSFNAVAYESVMLGVTEILSGPAGGNGECAKAGLPKQTGLHFSFSRDGRTFATREEADIAPEGWGSGKWDTGYLSPTGGICVVKDERLWFYYSGLRGDGERLAWDKEWHRNGMYSNGAIGVATLRRDGFAGMVADARGESRGYVAAGGPDYPGLRDL